MTEKSLANEVLKQYDQDVQDRLFFVQFNMTQINSKGKSSQNASQTSIRSLFLQPQLWPISGSLTQHRFKTLPHGPNFYDFEVTTMFLINTYLFVFLKKEKEITVQYIQCCASHPFSLQIFQTETCGVMYTHTESKNYPQKNHTVKRVNIKPR